MNTSVTLLSILTGESAATFAFAFGLLGFVISILVASRLGKLIQGKIGVSQPLAATKPAAVNQTPAAQSTDQTMTTVKQVVGDDQAVVCAISAAVAMMLNMEYNSAQGSLAKADPAVGFRIRSIRRLP